MNQTNRKPAGLVFFEGQEKPRQYVLFQQSTIKGQCENEVFTTNSLQLTYPFLDEEQCELFLENGKWYYRNLSQNTFTFVGGKKLETGEKKELLDNMVIRISNDRMLTAVFLSEFVSGKDWNFLNMDDGRHSVRLMDTVTLQYENGAWKMQEVLTESIRHNGRETSEPVTIQIDDWIQIGETRFIFEGSGVVYGYEIADSGISIQIDEQSVHEGLKKAVLLEDINLTVEPGNMIMVLGGSGAGKSTFVNAVTGYEKAKGSITEGDIDYYRDFEKVKHRIGFVPQDSLMREEDTVWNTVSNAADMRLPNTMSEEEKDKRVAAVLETFGLTGREKELISKLSGGQKKRLSISLELIASPFLFILDEPDSGLDGIMALELMENLRLIACQGKIVMVITHSPDRVAHLFDKVIVLARDSEKQTGKLAFYGNIQEARNFFGVPTMEEIVKRVNARNEGGEGRADEFINRYKDYSWRKKRQERKREKELLKYDGMKNDQKTEGAKEGTPRGRAGKVKYKNRAQQMPVYLGKQFRLFMNEKHWKVLPMAAVIAFLVIYVLGSGMFLTMENTRFGALAVVCISIWNGMFNSIQSVCKERHILKREHRAGLHITSYLAAHVIFQAGLCLLQVIIALIVFRIFGLVFPKTGLLIESSWLDVAISMFLVTFASDMLALMVSCIVHNTTTAMTVVPFLLIIQLVFAGTLFPLHDGFAQKLSNLTISNWGINAVSASVDYNGQKSVAVYSILNRMQDNGDAELIMVRDVMYNAEIRDFVEKYTAKTMQIPEYEHSLKNLGKCWGILCLFSVIYAAIGLFALKFIDRDRR